MSKQVIERGVKVPMRDGVMLAADIYRPADNEKHPVLIETIMMSRNNANMIGGMLVGITYWFIYLRRSRTRIPGPE